MEEKASSEALAIISNNTIQALRAYIEEKETNQVAVARACGLSAPVISQYLQARYQGDVAAVTKKIQDFLALEKEREDVFTGPTFVRTKQAEDVLMVCGLAHKHKYIGLVQARAGLGKTTTLREYLAHRAGACMITASTWNCSKGAIASLLGRAVRVSSPYSTLTDAVEHIVNKLGAGALVIIDEAQHLPRETLDGLRYIYDVAGVGVVLSGTLAVSARMSDKRVGINYEQLASRIGCRRTLCEKIEREDCKKIIEQAIPHPDKDVVDYCLQKANGPGAYRSLVRYLEMAVSKAAGEKENVGLRHFRAAEEALMV